MHALAHDGIACHKMTLKGQVNKAIAANSKAVGLRCAGDWLHNKWWSKSRQTVVEAAKNIC
jgi:hypothetical protein